MSTRFAVSAAQRAIREETLDGWLFYNLAHRDSLTDSLLGLDPAATSTRPWLYLVPAEGPCERIVHTIEPSALDSLPGTTRLYGGETELASALSRHEGKRFAILADRALPFLSTFPAGARDLLEAAGIQTVSAATLVQRVQSLLDEEGVASHERAARVLYEAVDEAWDFLSAAFRRSDEVFEGDVANRLTAAIARAGLVHSSPPIVAAGAASGNPHYERSGAGNRIRPEEVVQFDLWAKELGGIYADISWAGYTGTEPPARIAKAFAAVVGARDLVVSTLARSLERAMPITGAELDRVARGSVTEAGFAGGLRHRTGHGIDTACHGSGVNLDSIEFPDTRVMLEGSCFSVEPGIYFTDFGFRSEINVYIHGGKPVVSGTRPLQSKLLTLQEMP